MKNSRLSQNIVSVAGGNKLRMQVLKIFHKIIFTGALGLGRLKRITQTCVVRYVTGSNTAAAE